MSGARSPCLRSGAMAPHPSADRSGSDPAGTVLGSDDAVLTGMARGFVAAAAEVERRSAALDRDRRRLDWRGAAAERFHRWWTATVTPATASVALVLRQAAARLTVDGDEQVEASAAAPPSGPPARAVRVVGDLRTARHVAVLVPGMDTSISDLPRLVADAERLAEAAGDDVAVVAWLGYDTPKGLAAAARLDSARAGALRLVHDVERVRGATDGSVTVIGHSYGSTVTGAASVLGLRADRLVFLGSPGVGTEAVAGLDLPSSTSVYAGATDGDPVAILRQFGNAPTASSFGAVVIDAGVGFRHGAYYDDGSVSLANLARIVRGEQPTLRRPSPLEAVADRLRAASLASGRGLAILTDLLRSPGADPLVGLQLTGARHAGSAGGRVAVAAVDLLDDVSVNGPSVIRRLVRAGR